MGSANAAVASDPYVSGAVGLLDGLEYTPVFSSQMTTIRSNALPLTWLVGLSVLAVAFAAATEAVGVAV